MMLAEEDNTFLRLKRQSSLIRRSNTWSAHTNLLKNVKRVIVEMERHFPGFHHLFEDSPIACKFYITPQHFEQSLFLGVSPLPSKTWHTLMDIHFIYHIGLCKFIPATQSYKASPSIIDLANTGRIIGFEGVEDYTPLVRVTEKPSAVYTYTENYGIAYQEANKLTSLLESLYIHRIADVEVGKTRITGSGIRVLQQRLQR